MISGKRTSVVDFQIRTSLRTIYHELMIGLSSVRLALWWILTKSTKYMGKQKSTGRSTIYDDERSGQIKKKRVIVTSMRKLALQEKMKKTTVP